MIKTYRDLLVWQRAMDLAKVVYLSTQAFPKTEQFGLTNQLRRAVVSIASNVAEGNGRGSTQDYVRFLHIARGSFLNLKLKSTSPKDSLISPPPTPYPYSAYAMKSNACSTRY